MFTQNKKIVLGILIVILLIGAGSFYVLKDRDNQQLSPTAIEQEDGQKVNLESATEAERNRAENHKNSIVEEQNANNQNNTGNKVTPIITYAGQDNSAVEISAYVPGIAEDNGICTAYITNSGTTKSFSSKSVSNVSTTSCPTFVINTSDLGGGDWKVKVNYSSNSASGTSDEKIINVR